MGIDEHDIRRDVLAGHDVTVRHTAQNKHLAAILQTACPYKVHPLPCQIVQKRKGIPILHHLIFGGYDPKGCSVVFHIGLEPVQRNRKIGAGLDILLVDREIQAGQLQGLIYRGAVADVLSQSTPDGGSGSIVNGRAALQEKIWSGWWQKDFPPWLWIPSVLPPCGSCPTRELSATTSIRPCGVCPPRTESM